MATTYGNYATDWITFICLDLDVCSWKKQQSFYYLVKGLFSSNESHNCWKDVPIAVKFCL